MDTTIKSMSKIYDEMLPLLRRLAEMEGILKPCPGCGSMNQKPVRIDLECKGHKFPDSAVLICQNCGEKIILPETQQRINKDVTSRKNP